MLLRSRVQMAAGGNEWQVHHPLPPEQTEGFKGQRRPQGLFSHSTAQLPGPREGRGSGQIARGESVGGGRSSQPRRKERALYFLFFLPGRKRKLPKPRQQYFIGQTQGTWFELTERERPSPLRHTLNASPTVFSQEAQPPLTPPSSLGHSPTAARGPLTGRGSSCRPHHRHRRADLFPRLGALQEWGGARDQDRSFNVPSQRLNINQPLPTRP